MKILLLSDGSNWIVDKISNEYKKRIEGVGIDYYTSVDPQVLLERSKEYDIIHFNNTDLSRLKDVIPLIQTPMVMSVRSFRYPSIAVELAKYMSVVHVIHPEMKLLFPNAFYISDAVDDLYQPKEFIVGMAYQDTSWNREYKGVDLVKQACEELGVAFKSATNLKPSEMPDFYRSIDLYVCASVNEGFGTPILECMMLNKPVISTNVGMAKYFNILKVERTVEGIKQGILCYYTYPQVQNFRWEVSCGAMQRLYENIHSKRS